MISYVKRIRKSKLAKATLSYSIINILDKIIPFLLLPVFARIISKEDMGIYVVYQSLIQIFIPILTLSLQNSIVINYYHLHLCRFKKYFSNVFYFSILVYAVIGGTALLFGNKLAALSDLPLKGIQIIIVIVFMDYITDLRQTLWRNQHKVRAYGVFTIIMTLIKNISGLLFLFFFSTSWEGIVFGHLVGFTAMAAYAIYSLNSEGLLKLSFHDTKSNVVDALKVSFPLTLHKISAWLGTTVNRIIIANRFGSKVTANFGIGSTYYVICNVLFDALNKAYVPVMNENLKNYSQTNQKEKINHLVIYYYLIIITTTCSFVLLGYYSVEFIFGSSYSSTRNFIIPLTFAAGFNGLYKIHVNFIFYTKKTFYVTLITFVTAVVNIPLSIFLIVKFSLLGAAYSLLSVNCVYYIMSVIISNKLIPLRTKQIT